VGKPLSLLMPERFRAMHDAGIRHVVNDGVSASRLIGGTVEVVGLRKDGREFPLELSLATWEAPNGRFFSGIIRDISERKKAEEKIKALLETAPDPIVEVDGDGRIVLANARTDELFGYQREEILARPIEKLFAERSRQLVADRFHAVIAGDDASGSLNLSGEMWGQRKDGSEFPVDVTVSAVSTDEGIATVSRRGPAKRAAAWTARPSRPATSPADGRRGARCGSARRRPARGATARGHAGS
jgi:PAS domain S-box-containing protein